MGAMTVGQLQAVHDAYEAVNTALMSIRDIKGFQLGLQCQTPLCSEPLPFNPHFYSLPLPQPSILSTSNALPKNLDEKSHLLCSSGCSQQM